MLLLLAFVLLYFKLNESSNSASYNKNFSGNFFLFKLNIIIFSAMVVLLFMDISNCNNSLLFDKSNNFLLGFNTEVFKLVAYFSSISNNRRIFLLSLVSNNLLFSITLVNSSLNFQIVVVQISLQTSFSEELLELHLHK